MGWGAILGPAAVSGGFNFIGGELDRQHQERMASRERRAMDAANAANAAMQKEFAQMGIQWKVEDARKAGIHPLAALGASTTGFSPSFSFPASSSSRHPQSDTFRAMGQDFSRAISATMTPQQRLEERERLENMELQNELLRKQIDNISRPGNPPLPSGGTDNFMGGQGDSGVMLVKPAERTAHAPGRPSQEMGARPDVSYSRTDTGLTPVIPQGLSESMEDDIVGKLLWRMRNQILPNFGASGRPPLNQLPEGARRWRWSHTGQEWRPEYPFRAKDIFFKKQPKTGGGGY